MSIHLTKNSLIVMLSRMYVQDVSLFCSYQIHLDVVQDVSLFCSYQSGCLKWLSLFDKLIFLCEVISNVKDTSIATNMVYFEAILWGLISCKINNIPDIHNIVIQLYGVGLCSGWRGSLALLGIEYIFFNRLKFIWRKKCFTVLLLPCTLSFCKKLIVLCPI